MKPLRGIHSTMCVVEESMESGPGEVTQILKAMQAGDPGAADRLLPLVYSELHRLAQAFMRRECPDHTLQATALINDAYLRLAGEDIDSPATRSPYTVEHVLAEAGDQELNRWQRPKKVRGGLKEVVCK